MGVYDSSDLGKRTIELSMRRGIGTRTEITLDDLPGLQRNDDHMLRPHAVIRDARRLDDQNPILAGETTRVPPRQANESLPN
jgi:hypothetical protein